MEERSEATSDVCSRCPNSEDSLTEPSVLSRAAAAAILQEAEPGGGRHRRWVTREGGSRQAPRGFFSRGAAQRRLDWSGKITSRRTRLSWIRTVRRSL